MRTLLIIGTGGFIGSIFRYLIARSVQEKFETVFPYGTLSVNIIGCLLIGIILSWSERGGLNADWRMFLATGICGGFTTFSAFSNETLSLMRDGQWIYAGTYVVISIVTGLAATFTGYSLLKLI
ncbi:MAG: fluoride efflux transporter CrcB [Bacteroidia bacterium]|nr:fluoride efflux transporter CrcB [Bacteroidia bacterium]